VITFVEWEAVKEHEIEEERRRMLRVILRKIKRR